jgi:hypothetical protein
MFRPLVAVPLPALALGLAGLMPFVLGALAMLGAALPGPWARGLAPYALVILGFMAGVHWGAAMLRGDPGWRPLALSVVPALAGWAAFLAGGRPGLLLTAAAFAGLLAWDLAEIRRGRLPGWYAPLRVVLTGGVVLSLLAAALGGAHG